MHVVWPHILPYDGPTPCKGGTRTKGATPMLKGGSLPAMMMMEV